MPRVVIVGGGFAGLNAALCLAGTPVSVIVIDRENHHGFWPLLYQVATAGLAPDDIARPLRSILAGHRNIDVLTAEVTGLDLDARRVQVAGGEALSYDYLVLATGSVTAHFGVPGATVHAFALKSISHAIALRNHLLATLERADAAIAGGHEPPPGALTTVIAGGGPTGVELAGALAELLSHELLPEYRHLDLAKARIVVVEMADQLLPGFSVRSREAARRTLECRGVEVRLRTSITAVHAEGVTVCSGKTSAEIPASTVVWAAGVRASPLGDSLGAPRGRGSTVRVEADLSMPGHHEVFLAGDIAAVDDGKDGQLPQLAPVAIQEGRHAALNICRRVEGRATVPFGYHDHGIMATIGRRAAVAELPLPLPPPFGARGHLRLRGTFGWLAWLLVHLLFLIGFRNKAVVLVNWTWNYLTWERSSRVVVRPQEPSANEENTVGP